MRFGAVVLRGGSSSRMKRDKALLPFGNQTFLEHILDELSEFEEILISSGGASAGDTGPYPTVRDLYPGCGPMGGIHAALCACRSDALLALSCDLPLFRGEVGRYLLDRLEDGRDAVVPVTGDGRIHPLCGVYRKNTALIFERFLKAGHFQMRDALSALRMDFVPIKNTPWGESPLRNVNTPKEYEALCALRARPCT